jgi:hypothetical protein
MQTRQKKGDPAINPIPVCAVACALQKSGAGLRTNGNLFRHTRMSNGLDLKIGA